MEKKPVKIVTIGGGSSYTPELMEGFIKRYDELPIKEIWLVDVEAGKEKLEIKYIHENKDDLKEKLIFSRKEDMFSAVTSIGPHRDDIIFNINGNNARNFASQGQKRSIALSLKLAEAEVIRKKVGECPLCLMDDVMSELDPNRQNFVLNHVKEMQVFLTCCDPQNVKNLKAGKIFSVEQGMVK